MDIKANPEVTYTLEAFLPASGNWSSIKSGIKEEIEISELLGQLKIDPKCPRSPATAFRMVKVTRDVVQFMGIDK
ncbi:hypothetical protein pEaSNUABM30_00275 [Erwinia phage pEa_SNUABM_30]|uniref:Uncharacterized protein n=1 Tax=Erwinia phage pEa_SNUABM_30 TaxID=2869553 RepID=A0AAE8XLK1_9CAUD|nr:hypothetical protein MPK69_gp275 [Erwinia phage pEa_SNUABM_30]UAW53393.1 hypothetical protein pEaSNUABM30_00275 [Erwinia phage pEa_SNUABM_30]